MRQSLGKKKLKKLMDSTGLNIIAVFVRGGTDHRKDLCLADGSVVYLFKDGTLMESKLRHVYST